MTKPLISLALFAVVPLGACTEQASTPLAKLATTYGDTKLEIFALGQINAELHVDGKDCPLLGDDVVATFDGLPMNVTRGGYDTTADGCYPIAFWISPLPTAAVTTYEQTATGSDLVIQDATTSWTIASTRFFANQFVLDAAASRIVWQDVSEISTAQLVPAVQFTLDHNAIQFPAGTDITSVQAYAHPVPSRCDGPTGCSVDLEGSHEFKSVVHPQ